MTGDGVDVNGCAPLDPSPRPDRLEFLVTGRTPGSCQTSRDPWRALRLTSSSETSVRRCAVYTARWV